MNTRTTAHWIRIVFALMASALLLAWGTNTAYAAEQASSLSIASNGQIIAKHALVVSVAGSEIVVRTGWGSAEVEWVLHTTGSTRFVPEMHSDAALKSIQIGDSLGFTGTIAGSFSQPTVQTSVLRNESLVQRSVSVLGTVSSVSPDRNRFTIEANGVATTVEVYSGTLMSRNGGYADMYDVALGESVKVIGALYTADNVLKAERVWIKTPEAPASEVIPDEIRETNAEAPDESVSGTGVISAILHWIRGSRGMLSVR